MLKIPIQFCTTSQLCGILQITVCLLSSLLYKLTALSHKEVCKICKVDTICEVGTYHYFCKRVVMEQSTLLSLEQEALLQWDPRVSCVYSQPEMHVQYDCSF